jgi:Cdc6-like AAA superfamily ATPase
MFGYICPLRLIKSDGRHWQIKLKTPLSTFCISIIEERLAEEEEFKPRRELTKEIEGLRSEMKSLRNDLNQKEIVERLKSFTRTRNVPHCIFAGPPGTGKTLLAKAVAHETNAHFMRVVGSELVQKYIGEGARLVRELFDLAVHVVEVRAERKMFETGNTLPPPHSISASI